MDKQYLNKSGLTEEDIKEMSHDEVLDWLYHGGCDTPRQKLGEWNPADDTLEEFIDEVSPFFVETYGITQKEAEEYMAWLWWQVQEDIEEHGRVIYINDSYNGLAIFSAADNDNDCLYFTTWLNAKDYEYITDLADAEDKETADKMLLDFCSDCEKWEGNNRDAENGGVRNFDEFMELNDTNSWVCIYSDYE